MPEFIDLLFLKTSPKRSFLVIENERFGLVFAKTGSINSGIGLGKVNLLLKKKHCCKLHHLTLVFVVKQNEKLRTDIYLLSIQRGTYGRYGYEWTYGYEFKFN